MFMILQKKDSPLVLVVNLCVNHLLLIICKSGSQDILTTV